MLLCNCNHGVSIRSSCYSKLQKNERNQKLGVPYMYQLVLQLLCTIFFEVIVWIQRWLFWSKVFYWGSVASEEKYWGIKTPLKGALDKYDICIFILNSIEEFKLNQYRNFQLILPMRFHFMRYFMNSIIFRVSHRLLYCVFNEVD